MQLLQKTKKRLTYALAVALGSIATVFVINKDNKHNETPVDYQIINKASADLPYTQGYYQGTYGGGGGSDDDSADSADAGSGGGGGGGGVSDEYT